MCLFELAKLTMDFHHNQIRKEEGFIALTDTASSVHPDVITCPLRACLIQQQRPFVRMIVLLCNEFTKHWQIRFPFLTMLLPGIWNLLYFASVFDLVFCNSCRVWCSEVCCTMAPQMSKVQENLTIH